MSKKDFGMQLGASIEAQADSVLDRFNNADSVLSKLTDSTSRGGAANSPGKPKTVVVRHSFSMSEGEFGLVLSLQRAAGIERQITASEIIRAGLRAIEKYDGNDIIAAIDMLERLRPGQKI